MGGAGKLSKNNKRELEAAKAKLEEAIKEKMEKANKEGGA